MADDSPVMCSFGPLFPIAQYTLAVSLAHMDPVTQADFQENPLDARGMLHRHRPRFFHPHLSSITQPYRPNRHHRSSTSSTDIDAEITRSGIGNE